MNTIRRKRYSDDSTKGRKAIFVFIGVIAVLILLLASFSLDQRSYFNPYTLESREDYHLRFWGYSLGSFSSRHNSAPPLLQALRSTGQWQAINEPVGFSSSEWIHVAGVTSQKNLDQGYQRGRVIIYRDKAWFEQLKSNDPQGALQLSQNHLALLRNPATRDDALLRLFVFNSKKPTTTKELKQSILEANGFAKLAPQFAE